MDAVGAPAPGREPDIEAAVCGSVREPLMFWLWQRAAGGPDASRTAHIGAIERVDFQARDGTRLGGYRLIAPSPKGYLLVALGNAMLADQVVGDLQVFRDQGLDVYVFDYRGYGMSDGKSRLAAIVADYLELVRHLNAQGYVRRMLYGLSMGGVVLLNAVGRGESPAGGASKVFDALTVDSSPSRISDLGCPEAYDPVRHLPQDSARIQIIVGARDRVVPPEQTEELARVAAARGARVFRHPELSHPYQDNSRELHRTRQAEVARFLGSHLE